MKYEVRVTVEMEAVYEIEADSEEEAKEKAEESAMLDDFSDEMPSSAEAWDVKAITPDVEMEKINSYFSSCKKFWLSTGDSEGVATSKTFWWDCVEVWNHDKSWTPVKERWAWNFRAYKPGNPIPDSNLVVEGGV